ncbi:MAG: signal peptide peptidase SppA [Verrucomicrobia bacterium]|nr:signal peptide peptidase SppA [Verrucomicrobiota bacterium]
MDQNPPSNTGHSPSDSSNPQASEGFQPQAVPPPLRPLSSPPPPGSGWTPPHYPPPPPPRRSSAAWWVLIVLLGLGVAVVLVIVSIGEAFKGFIPHAPSFSKHSGPRFIETTLEDGDSDERILVINLDGIITSYPIDHSGASMVDLLKYQLEKAAKDSSVKAIVLKVDSPGGEVLASDDMYALLETFQEEHKKPVIACMGSLAASGGYYVSAPCQWIVANPLTITGSIGVIMSGYNYRGLMDKVGVRPEVFKSGKHKDMLSGAKREDEITQEERDMVQKMVNDTFGRFKEVVGEGRKRANRLNAEAGIESERGRTLHGRWEDYADGRILSGREAHELGFVDELGNFKTAVKRAATIAIIKNPEVFELTPEFDISNIFRLFGEASVAKVKLDVGLPETVLQPGRLYYLWSFASPHR